ncbi:MAG TPA: Sec-independent protein translocase protein TatB [Acidimicrobiales bacterium]|nr:Sec-independent protein translocase protein TatB [Acidimicrobiales bacterium]
MGNIGISEILVVLVVALLVLGPNRLPGAARQMGKALQEFRRVTTDFQTDVRDAFSDPGVFAEPPTSATGAPPPGAPSPAVEAPPADVDEPRDQGA